MKKITTKASCDFFDTKVCEFEFNLLKFDYYNSDNYMYCKITVKGIITNNDGKILLVKRSEQDSFWPGYWETVGGGMKEKETNLSVKVREPFNVYSFENEKNEFKVGITFICDYAGGEIVLSDENTDYIWIDPLDIKNYKTSDGLMNEILAFANKYNKSNKL